MQEFINGLITGLKATTILEYIAVIMGILSVYFSRKENILVFPTGLINTAIYIFLSYENHLIGETSVNCYYTVMNIWGWIAWSKMNDDGSTLHITRSSKKEIVNQLFFFGAIGIVYYLAITQLKTYFYPNALPMPDAIASAAAFTAMWLMTKKKLENWHWWIVTNLICMPIYYNKGLMLTVVQYFIFFIFAILGLKEWQQKLTSK